MEDDSLMRSECPDCQLQILQHQQGQPSEASNSQTNASTQYIGEERRLSQVNSDLSSSHSQSQAGVSAVQFSQGEAYQASHSVGSSQSRTVSSSHCQNVFGSYSKDMVFHQNSLSSHAIPVSSSMPNEIPMGTVPSVTLTVSSNGCYEGTQSGSNNVISTTAGEQCENYYCSTCSVYDIPNPSNEKFFRTNSSRPPTHVFPPIFYAQGPSSVIPCFSPIPDCTPWGNEYATYAYASASYSQSTSAIGTTDYYGYSVPTTASNTGNYNETMTSASNYVPSASYSSISASYCNTTDILVNEQPSTTISTAAVHLPAVEVGAVATGVETSQKHSDNNATGDDQGSVSIEISSTSSLDDSFSSSDDSEIDESSTLSDDRELISVVEDDEDHTGSNVHEAADSVLESHLNQRDSSKKCLICLGSMSALPECTSPQLAKILEHIDGEITTEDLDISVSSVDIEIGGIEDEMKAFTSLRKKSQLRHDITFDRLSQFLDTDKLKARSYKENSADNVPLCCRCHKLACLVDSYQKQMTCLLGVLNQLMSDNGLLMNSNGPNCSILATECKDIEKFVSKKSIETQTDEVEGIRSNCALTVEPSTNMAMAIDTNKSEDVLCSIEINIPTTTSTYANSVNELISTDCSLTIHTQAFQVDEGSDIQVHNSNNSPESDFVQRTDYQDNDMAEPPNDHVKLMLNSRCRKNPSQFESIPKKNTHECEFCKRKFTTRSYLRSHTEICKFKLTHEKHQDDRSLRDSAGMRCSKCGIGFRNVLRWTKHSEQGCQSTIYQCSECPQRFTKNSELKVHVKVHMKDKSYKCDVCNVAFTTKGNLIAHSRTHSSSKKFECRFCNRGFNRRFALTMHENRHKGLKLFRCNLCSKDFADPSNLNNHRKRSHIPFTIE